MPGNPETFLANADECDRRADTVRNGRLRELFRQMARQWRELARLNRSIEADAKHAADFYGRSDGHSGLGHSNG
jgi:hypothetical protein